MFYDIFKKLCNDRRETPNAVCLKLTLKKKKKEEDYMSR